MILYCLYIWESKFVKYITKVVVIAIVVVSHGLLCWLAISILDAQHGQGVHEQQTLAESVTNSKWAKS